MEVPVPPFEYGRVPETCEARLTCPAETTPVAEVWRIPEGEPESVRLVVEAVLKKAVPDTAIEVEDAKVMVWSALQVFLSERSVEDAAVIVMSCVPSKETPLMARAFWRAVAVEALPLRDPKKVVAVIAVDDAYGNVEAVEEVAVKYGAVMVLYATMLPLKSELPRVSKIFPVVVVADWPRRKTCPMLLG